MQAFFVRGPLERSQWPFIPPCAPCLYAVCLCGVALGTEVHDFLKFDGFVVC